MENVSNLLKKFARGLGFPPEEEEAFLQVLGQPKLPGQAIIWINERPAESPFALENRPLWLPEFVDRLAHNSAPGKHLLHVQGAYYVLDLSSVFEACILYGVPQHPGTVLDLCSAPGGKAIFSSRLLAPELLICNEVIGKRSAQLISNLKRCAIKNVLAIRHDVSVLRELAPATIDLLIVDAPCSGQSLLARGKKVPGAFHPATINLNSNRQKRIIATATSLVAPGGFLAYLTCTYSEQENEGVLRWLLKRFPTFQPIAVPQLEPYCSRLADFPCYRMWPQRGEGAGGFTALLQNSTAGHRLEIDVTRLRILYKDPTTALSNETRRPVTCP